jgi:predicted DNA-binding protein (UPF0251 family)
MPRPTRWRTVAGVPLATYFKPAGVPLRLLSELRLAVEEVEAIRLKDLEGLEQEECAQRMSISRPTFHRVLKAARQKIADALINGKAIRIEGGNFAAPGQKFHCAPYGHAWEISLDARVPARPLACPTCGSARILLITPLAVSSGRQALRRGRGPSGGRRRGEGE